MYVTIYSQSNKSLANNQENRAMQGYSVLSAEGRWLAFRRPNKCSWGSFSCLSDISGPEGNWYLHLETKLSNIIHLWSFVLLSLKRTSLSKWSQPKQEEQLWRRHARRGEGWNTYYLQRERRKEKEQFYKEIMVLKKLTSSFINQATLYAMILCSSHLPKPIYLYNKCLVCLTGHPLNQ